MIRALALLSLVALSHHALGAPTSEISPPSLTVLDAARDIVVQESALDDIVRPSDQEGVQVDIAVSQLDTRNAVSPSGTTSNTEPESNTTPNTMGKLDHLPETVYASELTPELLADLAELQEHSGASGMTNAQRMARGEPLLAPRKRTAPQPKSKPKARKEGRDRMDKRQSPLNPSQAASQSFTCVNERPFANCCQSTTASGASGTSCFFSFGSYDSQTCSPGYTGLCCDLVYLAGGNGQYTAEGCILPTYS